MKNRIILALLSVAIITVIAKTSLAENKRGTMQKTNLNHYKWKNRIILSYPKNQKKASEQEQRLVANKSQITDRDLIVLRLEHPIPNLTEEARKTLIKTHKITPGQHILIGKDGTKKSTQTGPLDLKAFFIQIDKMPMRQQELKSN